MTQTTNKNENNMHNHNANNAIQKINLGINGFGRIGKCVLRSIYQPGSKWQDMFAVTLINSNQLDAATAAYMYKYDTVHRTAANKVEAIQQPYETLLLDEEHRIAITQETAPDRIAWNKHRVDLVLECSGRFNQASQAQRHYGIETAAAEEAVAGTAGNHSGIRGVIVSAPAEGADATIICGVNDQVLATLYPHYDAAPITPMAAGSRPQREKLVLSAGSCTTNCLLPLLHVIEERWGIATGFMTTIHSYTNDQSLVDSRHPDRRRGRAAASSIIPTSTGITKTIRQVMPHLADRVTGTALRVPTSNVSLVDFTFTPIRQDISRSAINQAMSDFAKLHPTIMGVSDEELVSTDFLGDHRSCVIDLTQTSVLDPVDGGVPLCRIAAWYDNEHAFAERMLDICSQIATSINQVPLIK